MKKKIEVIKKVATILSENQVNPESINMQKLTTFVNNNDNVIVEIKLLHPKAQLPLFATEGAAGADCTAVSIQYFDKDNNEITELSVGTWDKVVKVKYNLGLAFELPKGYALFLFPRSSVMKHDLTMANCVGIIDCDYRGEVSAVFYINKNSKLYNIGERCCQAVIMPVPKINFVVKEELSETIRGDRGYGHTGN